MGRLKNKFNRLKRNLFIFGAIVTGLATGLHVLRLKIEHLYAIGALAALAFVAICFHSIFSKRQKSLNEDGYVYLINERELEHRHIAKKVMGRNLYHNEIVHHINGVKTENAIWNLCVMDRDKHEHFHSWLYWKKRKDHRYPPFSEQHRVLASQYGGILLKNFKSPTSPPAKLDPNSLALTFRDVMNKTEARRNEFGTKNLFNHLRQERKRIADAKGVPVYVVFDNRTLGEMARSRPHNLEQMAQIPGVGPTKLRMYGQEFLNAVRNFGLDDNANNPHKKRFG